MLDVALALSLAQASVSLPKKKTKKEYGKKIWAFSKPYVWKEKKSRMQKVAGNQEQSLNLEQEVRHLVNWQCSFFVNLVNLGFKLFYLFRYSIVWVFFLKFYMGLGAWL